MLFFAGRAGEGADILNRAQRRLADAAPAHPAHDQLEVALLGQLHVVVGAQGRPGNHRRAHRSGRPRPQRGRGDGAGHAGDGRGHVRALGVTGGGSRAPGTGRGPAPRAPARRGVGDRGAGGAAATDELDEALRGTDEILSQARPLGAAASVATILALRAFILTRRGDLLAAQADAQASMEMAPDLLGVESVVLAVSAAVITGLERDETPESLRRLIDQAGIRYATEFSPGSQLRDARRPSERPAPLPSRCAPTLSSGPAPSGPTGSSARWSCRAPASAARAGPGAGRSRHGLPRRRQAGRGPRAASGRPGPGLAVRQPGPRAPAEVDDDPAIERTIIAGRYSSCAAFQTLAASA